MNAIVCQSLDERCSNRTHKSVRDALHLNGFPSAIIMIFFWFSLLFLKTLKV